MHGCRNSLHCIVPPYMLRNIVENGTVEQRQQALRNLVSAEAVRIQREVAAKEGPPQGMLEAVGGLDRIVYSAQNAVSYTHLDVYKRQVQQSFSLSFLLLLLNHVSEDEPKAGHHQ